MSSAKTKVTFEAADALLPVGRGSRLLDVACGSGYACWVAAERGATVTGLDAAPNLIGIAKQRHPNGDFHVGDMFSLPFGAGMFDVVTSFNGIWAGVMAPFRRPAEYCGQAAVRDDLLGNPNRLGLYPYFATVAALSPPEHRDATIRQGTTGAHGIAEAMLHQAGFTDVERGVVTVWAEWPDVPTAVRALTAAGPSRPPIENAGAQPRPALPHSLERDIAGTSLHYRRRQSIGHPHPHRPAP